MLGGLPIAVFLLLNGGWLLFSVNSGQFLVGAVGWATTYAVGFFGTLANPYFFDEFLSAHVLARPAANARELGFDSLGGR